MSRPYEKLILWCGMTVTILVPTYEPDPRHLKEALESVLRQSFTDWELYIHDDCSHADVHTMVQPYLSDPRVHFARSGKNLGIGGNWNACLRLGYGEFIQFLFQDDVWEWRYLEQSIDALMGNVGTGFSAAKHGYIVEGDEAFCAKKQEVYDGYERESSAFRRPGVHGGLETLSRWLDQGLHPNVIGEPSFVMLRRSLVEECGFFDESMPQALDMEYWTRRLPRASWVYLPGYLGSFRVHQSGASARNQLAGHGLLDRLRIIESLTHRLPTGELRRKAAETLREQLRAMVGKYRLRKRTEPSAQGVSKTALLAFFLRHPLLVLQTMWDLARIQKAR